MYYIYFFQNNLQKVMLYTTDYIYTSLLNLNVERNLTLRYTLSNSSVYLKNVQLYKKIYYIRKTRADCHTGLVVKMLITQSICQKIFFSIYILQNADVILICYVK